MGKIVSVGSMAFDTIQTPFGKAEKVLGGSVNYFSLSASNFAPVQIVSVVGQDFPKDHLQFLEKRGISTEGIKVESGDTFHWSGSYSYDLNEAKTLATHLNVFEKFDPNLPASYLDSDFVFLGNILPALQISVRKQIKRPKFVALDTMNFWISSQKETLIEAIGGVDCVIINEAELRQLTGEHNVVHAAAKVRSWGPKILAVKRGEYGALLFNGEEAFSVPALPLGDVVDPTGAGDTFAGGFVGYLASQKDFALSKTVLRRAVVYGCVMASFTVQDFSFRALQGLTRDQIDQRYSRFIELTAFHG